MRTKVIDRHTDRHTVIDRHTDRHTVIDRHTDRQTVIEKNMAIGEIMQIRLKISSRR